MNLALAYMLMPEQLERKKHIGNDRAVLVFRDGDNPIPPNVVASKQLRKKKRVPVSILCGPPINVIPIWQLFILLGFPLLFFYFFFLFPLLNRSSPRS